MRTFVIIAVALALRSGAAFGAEPSSPASPQRLALGLNFLGAQLRWHFNLRWAVEGRVSAGSGGSDAGTVRGLAAGLRGYRFFRNDARFHPYLGAEAAYASASIERPNDNPANRLRGFGDSTGWAAGAFGGVEYRMGRRLAVDFDLGPHLIRLKERSTGNSESSWDFVGSFAVNVYLF